MTKYVHSFADRHPDRKEKIMEMAEQNTAFGDVCNRFGRLWDSLNEMENEPVNTERVQNEVHNLEMELLSMIDQMRV